MRRKNALSFAQYMIELALSPRRHNTSAQSYGFRVLDGKIRWNEVSHMGLDIHKLVLLWYLVNGVINIVRCNRVMHKGDGRMHFSEVLMHDEIAR